LGEGWGEGKPMPHSHRISEFGIAEFKQTESGIGKSEGYTDEWFKQTF
jgi:hypothetical protein